MASLTITPPGSPRPVTVQPSPCSIWAPANDELETLKAWDEFDLLGKSSTPPPASLSSLKESLRYYPQSEPRPYSGRLEKEIPKKRLFGKSPEQCQHTLSFIQEITETSSIAEDPSSIDEDSLHDGFEPPGELLRPEARNEGVPLVSFGVQSPFQPTAQPRFDPGPVAFSPFGLPPNTILVPTEDPNQSGQMLFRLMTLESGSPSHNQFPAHPLQQMYRPPNSQLAGAFTPSVDPSAMVFHNMQLDPSLLMHPLPPPVPNSSFLCVVEFKRGRTLQYESPFYCTPGDYVIVGGDRGEDLGMVTQSWTAPAPAPAGEDAVPNRSPNSASSPDSSIGSDHSGHYDQFGRIVSQDPSVNRVIRWATAREVQHLHTVQAELERRCTAVCQQKANDYGLVLDVIDAEYQFDRKKLTFFYDATDRQDFRELVKDLYKIYRARIWMEKVSSGNYRGW